MTNYIILSATLLAIGIYGLLVKRHLIKILISIEIIAVAASMNFVLLASSNKALGETFLILAFSTDVCLAAITLALFMIAAKKYKVRDAERLIEMEQNENVMDENRTSGEKSGGEG